MNIPKGSLNPEQERELDKVNAFYLQKEAEVFMYCFFERWRLSLADIII